MEIEFSRPEFHASVAEVRRAATELSSARARASGDVATLMDRWHGAAASAFAEAWMNWLDASADVVSSLSSIADSLETTHRELTVADSAATSSLDRLGGRLS